MTVKNISLISQVDFRFLAIILIIFLSACDPADNRLSIKNNANYPIYYTYSNKDSLTDSNRVYLFSDVNDLMRMDSSVYARIEAKSVSNAALTSYRWEGVANESKTGQIFFFFFPRDTLAKYNWEDIIKSKKYTGKAIYTIEDLNKIKWLIEYPTSNK